ncbi:Z1 domain-containing protein [Acinetobacter variabilis]|uniref:Z1 domain-containing protein n=1 Tax=Acinetobacter variabilis TaxID=70346 RepID=UPI0021CEF127|nr:Z1 domain-containing protein [Acinetobacter variabilis]MCU4629320.1 Z1 domain-containing protein [Acinetobacter variabilis]
MLNSKQYDVAQTSIIKCTKNEGPYEINFIEDIVRKTADFLDYEGSVESIVRYVESKVNCRMELGTSVVSEEAEHDKDWINRIQNDEKIYATAYENYLRKRGMPPGVVNSISRVNESILSLLSDPKEKDKSFQRRGLVIGDVQSGKTSNYLSLITKAADAGYKFIIVIAGIHNNLRSQTQQRIDEGFIGRISARDSNKTPIGVGAEFAGQFPHPVSFTTVEQDFNKTLATSVATEIGGFTKPVILVIKKNVTTLKNLYEWLVNFNMNGLKANGIINNVPLLMIDDEADNASINTNNPDLDLDPTKTNNYIRTILKSFNQACYVGYTATPFANIFIDPDSYGDCAEDLFPKDFIYNLEAPTNYFGARKIFLEPEYRYVHVTLNSLEIEKYIPLGHRRTFILKDLPVSLKEAIASFLIAKCIRNIRNDSNEHCSMLINVSTFVNVQNQIKDKVLDYIDEIRNEILAYSAMPTALEHENITLLHYIFNKLYAESVDLDEELINWEQIAKQLRSIFDSSEKDYVFKTCVVNSKSQDTLDYSSYGKRGLMVIAIGGFSLSRGLTIEGLTVSYFYRSTQMYDTLLQMGRWFGYRPQYEDLCRIYMTEEAFSWYEHITQAADDVRRQIAEMNQLKKTPRDFGLYVRASDEGLTITARNKMYSAQSSYLKRSFSGEQKEQTSFSNHMQVHTQNYNLLERFWKKLKNEYSPQTYSTGSFYSNIDTPYVIEFLSEYVFGRSDKVPANQEIMEACTRYLAEIQFKYPQMDILFRSKEIEDKILIEFEDIEPIERSIYEGDCDNYVLNKSRLGSPTDEKIGIKKEQIIEAKATKAKEFRAIRKKPLLICYLVELVAHISDQVKEGVWKREKGENIKGIPGLSLSFPFGDSEKQIQIYGNRIYCDTERSFLAADTEFEVA